MLSLEAIIRLKTTFIKIFIIEIRGKICGSDLSTAGAWVYPYAILF